MNTVNVALLGLGTVGKGVYKIITSTKNWSDKLGSNIKIKKVLVRDVSKNRGIDIPPNIITTDINEILNDNEIDIIVEVMGGIETSKEYILKALKSRKNVVTANKDLIAIYGEEIFNTAKEFNKDIKYEASVAGGIPIISSLKSSLIGNSIQKVMGIFNGTTNYILTKMEDEGYTYEEALKEAQELGFAEANPESDVEGYDAARKTSILASISFNSRVTFKDVYVEGITNVKDADFMYAKNMGYTIKLLGIASEENGEIEARVHPTFIHLSHPMASIKNEYNAVFVTGNYVGETMFYGKGAGEFPTASAIVGDIATIVRNINNSCIIPSQCSCYYNKKMKPFDEIENKFYVRLTVKDQPGVLAQISLIFAEHLVSIYEVIQKKLHKKTAELVIITDVVNEKSLKLSLDKIELLDCVDNISSVIRVDG